MHLPSCDDDGDGHAVSAVERVVHAVHERQLVGQVRDDRARVGQRVEGGERRAALEVDEHEVQRLGRMGGGQTEHQGAQELALAGPGSADAESVRPAAALGGLGLQGASVLGGP